MNAKLTAYALNELPPDERAALEAEMETNPALRAEAEEMRTFCSMIHDEVTSADKVALTTEQRVRVLREFTADSPPRKTVQSVWRHPAFWVPTAIAACTTALLVINLNHERSPAAKEMQVMLEGPEVERLQAGTSPERVLVTMEKPEKAVGQESQTPAPGKPEMPALVAANSPVSLGIGVAETLPSMPAPTVANDGAVILPKSMEKSGVTFSGVITSPVLAANEPAPTPMAADGDYGSVSALARGPQSATRGIEMGASRPLERYNLSPENLGEVPAEIRMGRVPAGSVDVNGRTDALKRSPDGMTLVPSGGLTISGGVMTTGDPAASINVNGTLQTDGSIANLADLPAMGQNSQGTGGIVKSGAGTLAISSPTKNAPATALPAGAEPFGPGSAMGIFGAGILPESEKDDALGGGVRTDYFFKEYIGATGGTSPPMAPATTIANSSSMAPAAATDGRVTFGKGTIAGTGGTSLPANHDFALADANKPAAKAKTAAGRVLDAPMDLSAISSQTPAPAPAPTAKPAASKTAAPSRATTLAVIADKMPDAAAAAPASPAPMAGTAGAAAPATTTAAPVIGEPHFALAESKQHLMAESLAPTEKELGELKRLQESTELRIKQLKDSEARARQLATRSAGGETYTPIYENPFLQVAQQPLSTFSIDVDTASYANVRRFLNKGQRPPADAVRLEELINYFPYSYEPPAEDGAPFSVTVDMVEAPWQPMHRLARIALKGREIRQERGAANFVFLVDVSGSMDEPDKLPLVKQSLRMLTEQIKDTDRVAIVTYAGESGVALTSTPGSERKKIQHAIEKLGAGGSTNGAGGIRMAYQQAAENFVQEGVNRVILCTDGDFNVGLSSPEELEKLIAEKAKSRVFLSVLGYGTGNLKDRTMETLADKGNGNYAYIDSLSEARKVLVDQMNATLVTIAKDVKIQVEFNPNQVAAYRLLGYENRALAKEDFNNDRKDAGEIGAGHTVTALYEIVPAGARLTSPDGRPMVDDLKYAPKPAAPAPAVAEPTPAPGGSPSKETMTVKLRYKQPEGDKSQLIEVPVIDKEQTMANAPRDLVFAASVTGFGMLLRNSQYSSELTWDMVRDMAIRGKGEDPLGYRGEFLQLIDKARGLTEGRE